MSTTPGAAAYEPTVDVFFDILTEHVPADEVSTLIEVGARDCAETLAFASKFPNAHIYTFECNPQTLPACHAAVDDHPNITLIPKAVAETNTTLSFFQFSGDHVNPGASSLLKFSDKYVNYGVESQVEVHVEATTLADTIAEHDITKINAIWLDIQGGELAALRSMGDRIRDVGVVYTEVEFAEMYADQPLFWDVWRYLRRRGFLLHSFPYKGGYFGDAVFVNRRHLRGTALLVAQARELRGLGKTWRALLMVIRGKMPVEASG